MAQNFRISARELGSQPLALQLFGDFDASSAREPQRCIKKMEKTSNYLPTPFGDSHNSVISL